jgi:hypothetical protein
MTDEQYNQWFVDNLQMFSSIGIMHPKSEWGKLVKICILASEERIRVLEQRISALESIPEKPKRKPRTKKSE